MPAAPLPAVTKAEETKIAAALAKLSPEDRRLVEAQVLCPIRDKNYLGAMGPPFKVMIQGQPVFLCCSGCRATALANPTQTLAKVERLRKAHSRPSGP